MILNKGTLDTLYVAFNTAYQEGFGQAPADHEPFTMVASSSTAKSEYGWLGQIAGLRKWAGDRVVDGLTTHSYTIENEKFESTVQVRRDDIDDDNLGLYGPIFTELGRAAGAHPCELAFGALKNGFEQTCYDGQNFFDTDHDVEGESYSNSGGGAGDAWFLLDCSRAIKPVIHQVRREYAMTSVDNLDDARVFMRDEFLYGVDGRCNVGYGLWQLAYGSKQALTAANYEKARTAMLGVKGDRGRPMGVMPTHLVVPPSLEKEGRELLHADRLSNGATNVYRDSAKLIVSPWLV